MTNKIFLRLTCLPLWSCCLLLMLFAVSAAWLWPVGLVGDDLIYMHLCRPLGSLTDYQTNFGAPVRSWGEACASAANHWLYINGRLSDIAYVLLQPLPFGLKFLNVLCAALVCWMVWAIAAAAGCWRRRGCMLLCIVLCTWALPWYDLYVRRTFFFNYVLPAAEIMTLVWLLNRERGSVTVAGACVLSFVTPWTHEIYGVATLVYLGTGALFAWRGMGGDARLWAVCLLFALLGMSLNVLAPGTMMRATDSPPVFVFDSLRWVASRFAVSMFPTFAALLLVLFAWLRRRRRGDAWLQSADLPASVCALLVSVAMVVYFSQLGRYAWCAVTWSVYLMLRCAPVVLPGLPRLSGRWWVMLPCCAVFLYGGVQLSVLQCDVSAAMDSVRGVCPDNSDHTVEFQTMDYRTWPWYARAFTVPPETMVLANSGIIEATAQGYPAVIQYVPTGLAGKPLSEWPKLPGRNEIYGADGLYFTPLECVGTDYLMTLGELTPSASPVERVFVALRGLSNSPSKAVTFNYRYSLKDSGTIGGRKVCRLIIGHMRRGDAARRVVSVDSVPRSENHYPHGHD